MSSPEATTIMNNTRSVIVGKLQRDNSSKVDELSHTAGQNHDQDLSVVSWNINNISHHSLGNKTEIDEFREIIEMSPIFCLQETKGEVVVPNYRCFNKNRVSSRSGGLCIGVQRSLEKYITQIETGSTDIQAVSISKTYTKAEKNITLINIYDSPENSSYKVRMKSLGVEENTLEALLHFIGEQLGHSDIMLVGDLNARTGGVNFIPVTKDWMKKKKSNAPRPCRASKDSVLNERGNRFLDLLGSCDLTLLNGNVIGDIFGELTCYQYNGQSVVDYIAVSPSIRNMVKRFKVLSLTNLSDHRPILCQLSVRIQMIAAELIQELHQDAPKRPKWDGDATAQQFTDNLNKAEITNQLLDISTSTLDTVENIYSTNKKFVHILESALCTDQPSNCANSEQKIRCFSKKKRRSKLRPKQKWFDAECITTKRELNILTRKYGKNPSDALLRIRFYSRKKDYKKLLKRKKAVFFQELNQEILQENKISWKNLKKLKKFNEKPSKLDIFDMAKFYQFFLDLYKKKDTNFPQNRTVTKANEQIMSILNDEISSKEVVHAVKTLKNGKAVGLDCLLNEQLKSAAQNHCALSVLVKLFNGCLDLGVYPWNTTIVSPLHKKGCIYDPDNYRAIAIGSNLGKLFATILLDRLLKFRKEHCPDTVNQLGFCKNARTVDHLFTLSTCVDKYVNNKGQRLYSCFVDFRKAFDSISREALLYKLSTLGIDGKFLKCLEHMYKNSKAKIKLIAKISDSFDILAGTEQGHPMSPELFKTYIHELSERLNSVQDISSPLLNETILTHLLWADDLVLLALSKESLQVMISELESFCREWGLTVNTKKTAIMIFNKSGRQLKESYGFQYMGATIPSAKTYCYLGITFSLSGSFKTALNLLRQKALRAYFGLKSEVDLNNISKVAVLKLLDSLILPVVSYGVEVWISSSSGIKAFASTTDNTKQSPLAGIAADPFERMHLAILKWTLGVGKSTSNAAVWGDCGRTPIVVRYVKQVTDFHNRLARLELEDSPALARHAFVEQKKLDLGWFRALESMLMILDENKLEHQLYNPLLCQERAHNRFIKLWETERQSNKKLTFYNKVKGAFEQEPYLTLPSRTGSNLVARIRMSGHKLNLETGRYGSRTGSRHHRICEFCSEKSMMELFVNLPCVDPIIEDEEHFLRTCPRYHSSRTNMKEPTKSLLFHDMKSLFLPEHIVEFTKFVAQLCRTRFPIKKKHEH